MERTAKKEEIFDIIFRVISEEAYHDSGGYRMASVANDLLVTPLVVIDKAASVALDQFLQTDPFTNQSELIKAEIRTFFAL